MAGQRVAAPEQDVAGKIIAARFPVNASIH
ncbi:hypothetical protein EDE08_11934 [Bradyrhizobium sp. R2.2-H]|jgi:hypothetical protein|nr:hypothetical protein EDE10_119108 [Bradyrhizobium sp. Y-H1]TCU65250.1 hypothetical protein EDE08_11934 [Bradyrhizobium sp. R2.2-H]